MSGSRLARGRVGRLALLACAILAIVFVIFIYGSTSKEMAILKDLHLKCAQQQESLAAQLQVIYEYKVQLEKTLSNEKSVNAAVKEELQQKASRERSLRDKDTMEAMQRYNSLQQNYKILQSEHQDLKDDCKKKEAVALDNAKKMESTLRDLRIQKKVDEDKVKSLEQLKIKYMDVLHEKEKLEERYESLKKSTGENNGLVERLEKQVIQLQRELDETKKATHFSVGAVNHENSHILSRHTDVISRDDNNEKQPNLENNNDQLQMARPASSQQQVSSPSDELQGGRNPQPLQAPQNDRHLDNNIDNAKDNELNKQNDDSLPNEQKSDIRFESRNGNIVPVGPNDVKDQYAVPILYQQQRSHELNDNVQNNERSLVKESVNGEEQQQFLPLPNDEAAEKRATSNELSSKEPVVMPILKPQAAAQSGQIDNEPIAAGDPNDFD